MDELQKFINDLTQHDVDLTSTLRRAKALTNDLHSPELDDWINSELYGYKDLGKVPGYRRFDTANYGDFAGPNKAEANGLLIPTTDLPNLPDAVREFAQALVMLDGIGALQEHGAKDDQRPWPPELVMQAQEATALKGGLFLIHAYQPIEESVYPTILEQVRNRLFDFLLDLQANRNASEDGTGPESVGRLVNYHIYGGHNVIATGDQVHQQVIRVEKGDATALLDYLRAQGVEDQDLQELEAAVESEPELLEDGNYGPMVGRWMGNMLTKASTGLWEIGLETASKTLPEVLNRFYGL